MNGENYPFLDTLQSYDAWKNFLNIIRANTCTYHNLAPYRDILEELKGSFECISDGGMYRIFYSKIPIPKTRRKDITDLDKSGIIIFKSGNSRNPKNIYFFYYHLTAERNKGWAIIVTEYMPGQVIKNPNYELCYFDFLITPGRIKIEKFGPGYSKDDCCKFLDIPLE